jgi:hypothetical protein
MDPPKNVTVPPLSNHELGLEIFYFIKELLGKDYAPKITGMVLDLDLKSKLEMLSDFGHFLTKITTAYLVFEDHKRKSEVGIESGQKQEPNITYSKELSTILPKKPKAIKANPKAIEANPKAIEANPKAIEAKPSSDVWEFASARMTKK